MSRRAADDGHDAAQLLARIHRGVTRPRRLAADIEDVRPGRRHRPCLLDGPRDRIHVALVPATVRQQAVAGERIGGHVQDPHHVRPLAPDEPPRPDLERRRPAGGTHLRAHLALTLVLIDGVAEERIVDEQAANEPHEVQRPGDDHRPVRSPQRRLEGSGRLRHDLDGGTWREGAPALRKRRCGEGPRHVELSRHDPRLPQRARDSQRPDHPVDILVGHRRGDEGRPAGCEKRPKIVERGRQGRRPGRVVGPVEQDVAAFDREQLQPTGPASRRVTLPTGRNRDVGDARFLEGVEESVGDRDVGRLVPPAKADLGPAQPRQLHLDAVTRQPDDRWRLDDGQRHLQPCRPPPNDRERFARRRRSRRRSPRSMIAAFSRAM